MAAACQRNETGDSGAGAQSSAAVAGSQATGDAVASIGRRTITSGEVDAVVSGQLAELDHQRYLLRRQATEALLLQAIDASGGTLRTASIGLVPPQPPAVTLPGVAAGLRPLAAVPVTITVFCDFESPHCAALQPVLADVLALYGGIARVAARDLPLPFHPNAALAAEAARCAGRQKKYWAFQDLLWARGHVPDRAELDAVAAAVRLDKGEFASCLEQRSEANAVASDIDLARGLGLGAVPAVFVNGRRVIGAPTADQLVWRIEAETGVAKGEGRAATAAAAPPASTTLPLALRATIVGVGPGLGLAVVGPVNAPASVRREGERVTPQAILRRVTPDGVELLVEGRIEWLGFDSRPSTAATAGRDSASPDSATAAVVATGAVPMSVQLDREMVRERMADRVALAAQLKPQPLTVDGYRVLKLEQVPPGSLYELLGLQPGDVIIMVNERPVHEGDNPLWDALDRETEVRVRVMRSGGLAQHYTYRFD